MVGIIMSQPWVWDLSFCHQQQPPRLREAGSPHISQEGMAGEGDLVPGAAQLAETVGLASSPCSPSVPLDLWNLEAQVHY